jgi:hypothetical protein
MKNSSLSVNESNKSDVLMLMFVAGSYVLCAAVSIPMMVDIFVDYGLKSRYDRSMIKYFYFSERCLVVIGLVTSFTIFASLFLYYGANNMYIKSVSVYLTNAHLIWMWGQVASIYFPGPTTFMVEKRPELGDPLRIIVFSIAAVSQAISGVCQYRRLVGLLDSTWLFHFSKLLVIIRVGSLMNARHRHFDHYWTKARSASENYYAFVAYAIIPLFVIQMVLLELVYLHIFKDVMLHTVSVVTINVFLTVIAAFGMICPIRVSSKSTEFELLALEKSVREKQSFIRYIGHEMRTPLNISSIGISLLVEYLENNQKLTKEMKEITDTMQGSINASTRKLDDLVLYQELYNVVSEKMSFEDPIMLTHEAVKECEHATKDLLFKNLKICSANLPKVSIKNARKVLVNKAHFKKMIEYVLSGAFNSQHNDEVTMKLSIVSKRREATELDFTMFPYPHASIVDFFQIDIRRNNCNLDSNQILVNLIPDSVHSNAELVKNEDSNTFGLFLSRKIVELFKGSMSCTSICNVDSFICKIELPLHKKYFSPKNIFELSKSDDSYDDVNLWNISQDCLVSNSTEYLQNSSISQDNSKRYHEISGEISTL